MSRGFPQAVALAVVLAACDGADDIPRHPSGDYAVYATAIDSIVRRGGGDERLVLLSPTVGDGPEGTASVEAMRDDADVPEDVRADFMAKNARRVPLYPESLAVGIPVTVVSRDSIAGLSDDPSKHWEIILGTFPGARSLVQVSRVGFSRDSLRALLYLDRSCGDRCGTGWKLQLGRDADNAGRILAAEPVWYQ